MRVRVEKLSEKGPRVKLGKRRKGKRSRIDDTRAGWRSGEIRKLTKA